MAKYTPQLLLIFLSLAKTHLITSPLSTLCRGLNLPFFVIDATDSVSVVWIALSNHDAQESSTPRPQVVGSESTRVHSSNREAQ